MRSNSISRWIQIAIISASCLVPFAGWSQNQASALKAVAQVEGITEYRLSNGLRVLLAPDASKPTTTVNIT
jgi:zinc protease